MYTPTCVLPNNIKNVGLINTFARSVASYISWMLSKKIKVTEIETMNILRGGRRSESLMIKLAKGR